MRTRSANLLGAAVAVALLTSSATPAWAFVETRVCNGDDTDCPCVGSAKAEGTCQAVHMEELISPDDPVALRTAANIQAVWDANDGVYYVDVDTRSLNGGGILPVHSNDGEWASVGAFHDYLEQLLDITIDTEALLDSGSLWPPMVVRQVGTTAKIDLTTGAWGSGNYNNLILDAVSGNDGQASVAGIIITQVIDYYQRLVCDGSDPYAFDSAVSSEFRGQQCSHAYQKEITVEVEGFGYRLFPSLAQSVLGGFFLDGDPNNGSWQYKLTYLCTGPDPQQPCDMQVGPLFVYVPGFTVDLARLESTMFRGALKPYPQAPLEETDLVGNISQGGYDDGFNGVCSDGHGEEGARMLDLQTRDGYYGSSQPECMEI